MSNGEKWSPRTLYSVFIGEKDRFGQPIDRDSFDSALFELTEELVSAVGGLTRIRTTKAEGETSTWGREGTTVILVLTDNEQRADGAFEGREQWLVESFLQDEIWILKQRMSLFVAK